MPSSCRTWTNFFGSTRRRSVIIARRAVRPEHDTRLGDAKAVAVRRRQAIDRGIYIQTMRGNGAHRAAAEPRETKIGE
jgi:hypothetical protein